jgi:glycosyltransferase involved in cell wall biosynthesis
LTGGCCQYRAYLPNRELKAFGVEVDYTCFLPKYPGTDPFAYLVNVIQPYDCVILQRCYLLTIVNPIQKACEFLGIPFIFETDDDYLHLLEENPAYYGMLTEAEMSTLSKPEKEYKRAYEMERYRQLLELPDMVLCSTEELKNTIYPFNKNVVVLENNVEHVYSARDVRPENEFVTDSLVHMDSKYGLYTAPAYWQQSKEQAVLIPRVGYTGTPSHRGLDWQTVSPHYPRVIEKFNNSCRWVYVGDEYFAHWHNQIEQDIKKANPNFASRLFMIPAAVYDLYMFNIRNLDIGMAPLHASLFNMSKSDIKAVELGAWGIPSVLPNYVTYSRHWTHGENCLLYSNGKEFIECMSAIISDMTLRSKLGQNAQQYVAENRLEKQHAEKRYDVIKDCVDKKRRLPIFTPGVAA